MSTKVQAAQHMHIGATVDEHRLLRSSQKLSDEGGEAGDDEVSTETLPSRSRAPGEWCSAHVKICAHASPRMGLSSSAMTFIEDGSIISIADEISDDRQAGKGSIGADREEKVHASSQQSKGSGNNESIAARMVWSSIHTGNGLARRLTSSARSSSLRCWH